MWILKMIVITFRICTEQYNKAELAHFAGKNVFLSGQMQQLAKMTI